ncbi:hypothetical protein [Homoserinimonas sp. A520]
MASELDRSGSRSICCDPLSAPIAYHWYQLDDEPSLISAFRSILASEGIGDVDRDRFIGEFRSRIIRAQNGRLRPVDNVKGPMETETRFEMFEIRWRFEFGPDFDEALELRVRAYHVEPKRLRRANGSTIVGLHIHKKTTTEAQDTEIQVASQRYFSGHPESWGLQND